MIDLHTHSTASDGSMSPKSLVALAEKIGLRAMALTDHDTVDGLGEAIAAAESLEVELVPGIELSCALPGGTLHIVGLFVDHLDPGLSLRLERVMRMRNERNPRLAKRLAEIGVPVTMEEAAAASGTDVVGRPHFAQVMIEKGYVADAGEAFTRYLGKDGLAHVEKERLNPDEAIALIAGAGGVPILAHPDQTKRTGDDLDALVWELKEMGLMGIETFCSPYHTQMVHDYSALAKRHGLLRSGGTDFHGAPKPKIKLGRGFGSLYVHDDILEPIREAARSAKDCRSGKRAEDQN